ncbi:basic proline-rich protein-like [Choloepus didactylus]|uniref:basic proline-rich protein-like n=1 Tax=Choloepus didactylus TaxID=27675 RepID=UPI0018A0129D|nr:basic proline-rich protein-like [Choloepus didactylus]
MLHRKLQAASGEKLNGRDKEARPGGRGGGRPRPPRGGACLEPTHVPLPCCLSLLSNPRPSPPPHPARLHPARLPPTGPPRQLLVHRQAQPLLKPCNVGVLLAWSPRTPHPFPSALSFARSVPVTLLTPDPASGPPRLLTPQQCHFTPQGHPEATTLHPGCSPLRLRGPQGPATSEPSFLHCPPKRLLPLQPPPGLRLHRGVLSPQAPAGARCPQTPSQPRSFSPAGHVLPGHSPAQADPPPPALTPTAPPQQDVESQMPTRGNAASLSQARPARPQPRLPLTHRPCGPCCLIPFGANQSPGRLHLGPWPLLLPCSVPVLPGTSHRTERRVDAEGMNDGTDGVCRPFAPGLCRSQPLASVAPLSPKRLQQEDGGAMGRPQVQ